MKIIDLRLDHYGIYRKASWKPSQNSLNVIMGENESGKTTMLRFIRDMIFGYGRGKWQGKTGSITFVRSDGQEYKVIRDEKECWFENSDHVKFEEELPALWWHGLNRFMYEKIFAIGLEDLQGLSFLSNDSVRSRFFMLQGGDKISTVKKLAHDNKEKLLVSSPQGKRKINLLIGELDDVSQQLDALANQEKDFSDLQKKQDLLKKQIEELQQKLNADKEKDKTLEKRLGAWEYYKRACEIKRQLDLSMQVKMFPTNGKDKWNEIMNRMKSIHDQKESLQAKIDEYTPIEKEKVIPWAGMADELEKLYVDIGQWRQTIEDADRLEKEHKNWEIDFVNMGYQLPLWDHPLDLKEPCVNVNWEEGRRLAQSVGVRKNELYFWQQREPEVEQLEDEPENSDTEQSENEWKNFEEMAKSLEGILHQRTDINHLIEEAQSRKDRKYTAWFWISICLIAASAASVVAFYMAMIGYAALYGAAAGIVLGVVALMVNSHIVNKKAHLLQKYNDELANLEAKRKEIASHFPGQVPESVEDLQAFQNLVQQKRTDFYKDQARRQAVSWKREAVRKQQAQHEKWVTEGKELNEKAQQINTEWSKWLKANKLPETDAENLSLLQEQWQRIFSEEGKGKILALRLEHIDAKLDAFAKRAASIIRSSGIDYPVTPDSIADIYEENQRRMLEWQGILEKNRQHEAYQKEMAKLNDSWNSCQNEAKALMDLVNAKNAEEFAEKVEAYEHHDQILKEWKTVQQDLRLYAGSEESFIQLWDSLKTGQYDDWMSEHQELSKCIAEEDSELGELRKNQGAVENEIFRLADDNTITETLQKKEKIEAELKSALEEWLVYMYLEKVLEKTQSAYESGKQPKIIEKANGFLREMTHGRYTLTVSSDGKDIGIIDKDNQVRDPKIWSSGTGDQVYLAIRLAMALSFGEQIEPLPIVLDDIFVRFDEKRQEDTLRFLMDLGKTQQIFLFTCHAQTMKIAKRIGEEKNTGKFIYLKSGEIFELAQA